MGMSSIILQPLKSHGHLFLGNIISGGKFALLPFPIAIAGFVYSWYKTSKVSTVIQEHFNPWKERGIEVDYRFPRTVGRRQKEAGRIVLTLPSTISDPNYTAVLEN